MRVGLEAIGAGAPPQRPVTPPREAEQRVRRRYLHERVDDELFSRVVHASLFVIGVKLLYDASGV